MGSEGWQIANALKSLPMRSGSASRLAASINPAASRGGKCRANCPLRWNRPSRARNIPCGTGPATMAHFHGPADAGKNAPVEIALKSITSPLDGSAVLTDAQAADLMAGKLYFNIHTDANKGGEVRGQVLPEK